MECPYCAASSSSVVRSRGLVRTDAISRTRRCDECGRTFPTVEGVDATRLAAQRAKEQQLADEQADTAAAA